MISTIARLLLVLGLASLAAACDVRLRDEYVDSGLLNPTDRPKPIERDMFGDPILPHAARGERR